MTFILAIRTFGVDESVIPDDELTAAHKSFCELTTGISEDMGVEKMKDEMPELLKCMEALKIDTGSGIHKVDAPPPPSKSPLEQEKEELAKQFEELEKQREELKFQQAHLKQQQVELQPKMLELATFINQCSRISGQLHKILIADKNVSGKIQTALAEAAALESGNDGLKISEETPFGKMFEEVSEMSVRLRASMDKVLPPN